MLKYRHGERVSWPSPLFISEGEPPASHPGMREYGQIHSHIHNDSYHVIPETCLTIKLQIPATMLRSETE